MANEVGDSGDRDSKGRVIGRSTLTSKQARFVTELKKGATQTEAARRAGYAHPDVVGAQLLRHGTVADLIRNGRRRIINQAASASIALMAGTATGKYQPSRVQFDAARYMIELDRQMRAEEDAKDNGNNSLRGLSLAELESMAQQVKKPIAPMIAPPVGQPIEKTVESTV